MSTSHDHAPITPVSTYVMVFLGLLVFTGLTVYAAYFDFSKPDSLGPNFAWVNLVLAMTIAVTKGTLVVWFFMGVRHNTPLTKVVVVSGFVWLLILFGVGMSDYLTRPWLGVPGR